MATPHPALRIKNPVLFICDIQTRFAPVLHGTPALLSTARKLLRASSILAIPIIATTQQRAKLGETCPELELDSTFPTLAHADKTCFSMWVPEVQDAVTRYLADGAAAGGEGDKGGKINAIIVGLETHICVTQTALDLLAAGHGVYVVADGVSSCNAEERGVALERLRGEGARVVSSEGVIYEVLGDAAHPRFKEIAALVKETKTATKESLQTLCRI